MANCGEFRPDGITSFSRIQIVSDAGNAAGLVYFLFDLLYLDGEDLTAQPVIERKARLPGLLSSTGSPLHYSDHQIGRGPAFHEKAWALGVEGIVSKRIDAPYVPRQSRLVAQGHSWSSAGPIPRARGRFSALLLGYYDPDGKLVYAGRVRTGINQAELARLWAAATFSRRQNAARRAAAALDPLRLALGSQPRPLGAARARGRGQVSHLDPRESAAPGRL
jgi:ATP-dependent DNA ligase